MPGISLSMCEIQLYMLSMMSYGVEYPFGQLGSAVPAVSPPNSLCTPSLLAGIVSIMTLTVLAYERYIRVVHAKVIDFSWSWRAITYIWLYSLAWTGAPLLGWNRYTLEIHGLGCSVDWKSKDPNDTSFVLLFFLGCLVAPVGIMAYCYGHILYAVKMLRCVEDFQTVQVIKLLKYEKKVAKMCFLMISTFLICWMPYAVVSLLVTYGYSNLVTPTVAIIPSFFAKSSTAYNPIIYIFMSRKFRRCLLQLLCFRLMRFQRTVKETPATGNDKPIRPIVMSQKAGDRPKKKVTFSSSSIIFIITSDDTQQIDDNSKHNGTKVNVIQEALGEKLSYSPSRVPQGYYKAEQIAKRANEGMAPKAAVKQSQGKEISATPVRPAQKTKAVCQKNIHCLIQFPDLQRRGWQDLRNAKTETTVLNK
ncbi:hypothetical protein QYF61_000513 [Mycteria americana]|uniref:Opsin-3 n=1 Tax=Mycteria americana TaxID=33587 RepID=A0AAN7NWQ2_MYCAM|nr:hypothetical protein QYF61_000513 [Mycteria americana]